jgi:hypothetical protein
MANWDLHKAKEYIEKARENWRGLPPTDPHRLIIDDLISALNHLHGAIERTATGD